jgi:peptide/nickel transport system ATP-binding protein
LAGNPSLLIADEPTSALDTVVQRHIVNLLDELVRDSGLTLLFVTHDIALASERADQIAVLYKGRLVELGSATKVLGQPQHPYTKALIGTHIALDTPRRKRLAEIDTDDLL